MESNEPESATRNERESDHTPSWAVELVKSLSDSEKEALKDATAPAGSRLAKVARVVQKIVQMGARHIAQPSKSKPGPKKNTNPTDEDINALILIIRMLLHVPRQFTRMQVLTALSNILHESNVLLDNSLLLLLPDRNLLIHGLREWGKHESESSIATSIHEWIQELDKLKIVFDEQSWEHFVTISRQKFQASSEQQLIAEITKHLRLHQAPLIESGKVDLSSEDQGISAFPEFKSIKSLELCRRDVFWSAIHRLIHLKTLVTQRQFSWSSTKIKELCTSIDLEMLMCAPHFGVRKRGLKTTDRLPDKRRNGMSIAHNALLRAAKRQGISPVHDLLIDLPSGFFRPRPPGVVLLEGESVAIKSEWDSSQTFGETVSP